VFLLKIVPMLQEDQLSSATNNKKRMRSRDEYEE
jgi:hypothetical protein